MRGIQGDRYTQACFSQAKIFRPRFSGMFRHPTTT